ncbi:hypothetical protein [Longitalea arenae]|uniref:hypothetical protein n=1 Tax=Longitalea arenae TaxID=2812558 RepID=UPI0019676396|nr:hypothetical protein [Longitalea arenae]
MNLEEVTPGLLDQEDNSIERSCIYILYKGEKSRELGNEKIRQWLRSYHKEAVLQLTESPNAFTQIFSDENHPFETKFTLIEGTEQNWNDLLKQLSADRKLYFEAGPSSLTKKTVKVKLDHDHMAAYGIDAYTIERKLESLFSATNVAEKSNFGDNEAIKLINTSQTIDAIDHANVIAHNGESYPIRNFIHFSISERPRFITADMNGEFRSIIFTNVEDPGYLMEATRAVAVKNNFLVRLNLRPA